MSQTAIPWRSIVLIIMITCAALCTVGCNPSDEVLSFQRQNHELMQQITDLKNELGSLQNTNQMLNQRVAELENQLQQSRSQLNPVLTAKTDTSAASDKSLYQVVPGDSLWSIAEKQLGNGIRYKEIVAMNPNMTEQQTLAVGTRLNLPSK